MTEALPPATPEAIGPPYRERPVEIAAAAFLSIDMQNAFCAAAARRREAAAGHENPYYCDRLERVVIPNQRQLLAACRRLGIETLYTVIESLTRDGRDRGLDHKISGLHVPRGSWQARVIDELAPAEDDIVLPKTASGVFNATNIDYVLRNLGVRFLLLAGIVTDQCVDTTVRDAADRGYLVTVIEDACATFSQERHDAALRGFQGYCRIRSTAALIAELETLAGGPCGQ